MPARPKILFLAQSGDNLPSVRFRVLPYVRLGRERGYDVGHARIPKSFVSRLKWFGGLERHDAIIIQKKLFSGWEPALLKRKCGQLVFDFDDALWTSHPGEPPGPKRDVRAAKDARRFARQCGQADLVIAGNEFLAKRARQTAKRVEILPTPLDTDIYAHPLERGPDRCVIGWMGTSSNLMFLDEVFGQLRPILASEQALVVADKPYPGSGADLARFEKWSPETEVALLQSMDIGLMPLTDDEYTRGKCGFKLLQYMACGAVPVAADVGFNREVIDDGLDGFLVRSPSEWLDRVGRLREDAGLRERMRQAAREKVVARFGLKPAADKLWKMLGMPD